MGLPSWFVQEGGESTSFVNESSAQRRPRLIGQNCHFYVTSFVIDIDKERDFRKIIL